MSITRLGLIARPHPSALAALVEAADWLTANGAHVVALVKLQFEAGKGDVGKGGIVKDERIHARVVDEVIEVARQVGLSQRGLEASPITGTEGNREFLLHLTPALT